MNTYAGTNTYGGPLGSTAWTNSAGSTEVPADQWNSTLMNSLNVAAYKQKFNAPFLVAGEALHYVIEEARQNRGNLAGEAASRRPALPDLSARTNLSATQHV